MRKPSRSALSVRKTANYAVITNALQVALMLAIALYVLLAPSLRLNDTAVRAAVVVAALIVAVGAALDIRDALLARRLLDRIDAMGDTIQNMEQLNNTLRAQRHDFLNHLQVVYSLMELGDYDEANAYIEKVYGAITAVSRVMKTANAPINALLQVKSAACEKAGIAFELNIRSAWKALPLPGWEMCKVLSNLIDNAMDALQGRQDARITVTLTEDLHSFRFTVADNGPGLDAALGEKVFDAGVTTKSDGHGMGLYITRTTLREAGGDIAVTSSAEGTSFEGWVPKAPGGMAAQ